MSHGHRRDYQHSRLTNAELFAHLFPGSDTDTEAILARWVTSSRRFQSFLVEYRDKVRRKLRLATTPESQQSLLFELDVARHLLEDARCQVEYEKYGQSGERSPDLNVTFRSRTGFNLEITRVQMAQAETDERVEKVIRIVCEKMGQMIPSMLNVLVVGMDGGLLTEDEIHTAMKSLKRRAEERDNVLLSRAGYGDPAGFFKQFQWLNAIIFASTGEQGSESKTVVWTNPQAHTSLPPDIRSVVGTIHCRTFDREWERRDV